MFSGSAKPASKPRRDHRFSADGSLRCDLGAIADLSASGMRIKCDARPDVKQGASKPFKITFGSKRLTVPGQVVWVRRCGWMSRTWQVGVRFTDTRPSIRKALASLAELGNLDGFDAANESSSGGSSASSSSKPAASIPKIEDLYAVLDLAPGASEQTIKAVYRELARQLHPDQTDDPQAHARFEKVSKAYAILRDPVERKRYDELLARSRAA